VDGVAEVVAGVIRADVASEDPVGQPVMAATRMTASGLRVDAGAGNRASSLMTL
jgi:hypothetical protein